MRVLFRSYITAMASAALFACSHAGTSQPPAAGESAPEATACPCDEAATSLREHHRHHHNGGITAFIAMGLDTLGADPAKHDEVEKIEKQLSTSMQPARDAEKHLMLTIADGIGAGKIDNTKVGADLAKLTQEASAVSPATAATLNELHDALSPAERAALVGKVQAHWEVWRKVNHDAEAGSREDGSHLDHFAHEVNLTPEQVDQISAALHKAFADAASKFDPKAVETHLQAFTTAFSADKFDAKSLQHGDNANGLLAEHGAHRMATFYETVTPLLTADQRTKLAERIHEHLNFQQVHENK